MSVEVQLIIDIVLIFGAAAGGWVMKMIWDRISKNEERTDELAEKVGNIQVLVAGSYVKSADFNAITERIFTKLDEIQKEIRDRK